MSQSGRSEHDETTAGWEPGQYDPAKRKSDEWRLKITVAVIVLLLICAFVCAALGAYYYI